MVKEEASIVEELEVEVITDEEVAGQITQGLSAKCVERLDTLQMFVIIALIRLAMSPCYLHHKETLHSKLSILTKTSIKFTATVYMP